MRRNSSERGGTEAGNREATIRVERSSVSSAIFWASITSPATSKPTGRKHHRSAKSGKSKGYAGFGSGRPLHHETHYFGSLIFLPAISLARTIASKRRFRVTRWPHHEQGQDALPKHLAPGDVIRVWHLCTRIFRATKTLSTESQDRRAAKSAGKLAHDSPNRTRCPIGCVSALNFAPFGPKRDPTRELLSAFAQMVRR